MVQITDKMIRERPEHNDRPISTLQELCLQQEYIEKIENIQDWCKGLKILLLQGNLISRIENLQKLRQLQYINLAINNIEIVENLQGCKSLEKLDLTLNFIGNLDSVCGLHVNIHLRELDLTGNPCADFQGYRQYIISQLPQLRYLDGSEITSTERLQAVQNIDIVEYMVDMAQEKYRTFRSEQRDRLAELVKTKVSDSVFWRRKSEHCPEVRLEMGRKYLQMKLKENRKEDDKLNKPVTLFSKEGRPLNVNEDNLMFKLVEKPEMFELHLRIRNVLDSESLNIALHPTYVTINIEGRVFQLVFPQEINVNDTVVERSKKAGLLQLRLPKASRILLETFALPSPSKSAPDDIELKKIKDKKN